MYEELVETLRETADKRMHEAADAIEALAKDLERSKDYEAFWQHEAEEALRRFQVAVANKPRWIPVTERLPENRSVLIYSANGGVAEGRYSLRDNKWYQYRWGVQNSRVTHWMPLPEPPKEET